ncbi:PE family protein, partial [Mycobacterium tuberculosis]
MSHVTAAPNVLAASAGELAAIGSTMRAANAAAAAPTAGVLAAGGDDVSAGIAALFGARAQAYQAISAQAALFHDRFVQILQEGAAAYAMAEAANALPLQKAQGVVSELAQDRTGGTGTGQSRGAGGFGGVGQAGGKGWDGGPIGNGQVGEQHGAGQLGSTDGNPGVAGAAHGSGVSASHGSGAT